MPDNSNLDDLFVPVDQGMRSARTVLLTVNVICAFLFLMVFELVLGWQGFRGSASRRIYAESLARLAEIQYFERSNLNEFDRGVLDLANCHTKEILGFYDSSKSFAPCDTDTAERDSCFRKLRSQIQHGLDSLPVWYQEERIRVFAADVKRLQERYKDSVEIVLPRDRSSVAHSTTETRLTFNSTTTRNRSRKKSKELTKIGLEFSKGPPSESEAFTSNYEISFHVQEILDRFRVNEETRGRRVGRREFEFPIIGTTMQIEDISLPVAIFLMLLAFWLYTATMRAFNSAKVYLQRTGVLVGDPRGWEESHIGVLYDNIARLVNRFQFVRLRERSRSTGRCVMLESARRSFSKASGVPDWETLRIDTESDSLSAGEQLVRREPWPDLAILWLFLSPFLVVTSGVLANCHESFLNDVRWHGTAFQWREGTLWVFVVTQGLVVGCAVFLFRIAFKLRKGFLKLAVRCSRIWEQAAEKAGTGGTPIHMRMGGCTESGERSSHMSRVWSTDRATFGLIAVSPFVVFGAFSTLYSQGMGFERHYFVQLGGAIAYLVILALYVGALLVTFSRRELPRLRRLGLGYTFILLPLSGILALPPVSEAAKYFYVVLLPTGLSVLGIIAVGFACRVYDRIRHGMRSKSHRRDNG
ncbi:hypothetical protein KQH82_05475 [bacterium]|nr:hypothetical protein [bacterium]